METMELIMIALKAVGLVVSSFTCMILIDLYVANAAKPRFK